MSPYIKYSGGKCQKRRKKGTRGWIILPHCAWRTLVFRVGRCQFRLSPGALPIDRKPELNENYRKGEKVLAASPLHRLLGCSHCETPALWRTGVVPSPTPAVLSRPPPALPASVIRSYLFTSPPPLHCSLLPRAHAFNGRVSSPALFPFLLYSWGATLFARLTRPPAF